MKQEVSVLVVDDQQMIIEGIKHIFDGKSGVVFAGGANSAREALAFIMCNAVNVVLTDINMPDESGIELIRMIKHFHPEIEVLVLSMYDDVSLISEAIDAGASGYLLKQLDILEVVKAISTVASGEVYLGKRIQQLILEHNAQRANTFDKADEPEVVLSTREKEIRRLCKEGLKTEQISAKLQISVHSVNAFRRNILLKSKMSALNARRQKWNSRHT